MSYDPQSGGNVPPPGGYTPPPPSGGYTPPPPPPPGGGYTPPPPPPSGMGGPGGPSLGGVNQAEMQGLIQQYINVVTKPNAGTFEAELPRANWRVVWIGVIAVAVISAIMALLRGLIGIATAIPFMPTGTGNTNAIAALSTAGGVVGFITTLIVTPIAFFLGGIILYGMAKILGGQGNDIMAHYYLLSLSWTPLRAVAAVLSIIPILGGFIGLILFLYQLVLAGFAMQVSQRMTTGRAMAAAFIPLIVGIVLFFLCFVLLFAAIFASINAATSS